MARILLNSPAARSQGAASQTQVQLGTRQTNTVSPGTLHLSPARVEARLREKRSLAYVEALTRLDAGTHVHNVQAIQSVLEAIRQELPELSIDQLPQGIVSRCYLGEPYEVHTLDAAGMIIQHYKTWEPLPPPLERARALAQHPGYAFIEIYPDKLIAVTQSGEASIVPQ